MEEQNILSLIKRQDKETKVLQNKLEDVKRDYKKVKQEIKGSMKILKDKHKKEWEELLDPFYQPRG